MSTTPVFCNPYIVLHPPYCFCDDCIPIDQRPISDYSVLGVDQKEMFQQVLNEIAFEIMYKIKLPELCADWGPVETHNYPMMWLNILHDRYCHYPPLPPITPTGSEITLVASPPPKRAVKTVIGVSGKTYPPPR